jgi:hypothetical protein
MQRLNAVESTTFRPAGGRPVGDLSIRWPASSSGRRVDAVDAVLGDEHLVGADLERALGGDGVGGEVRQTGAGAEDDDAALLHVPLGAARM